MVSIVDQTLQIGQFTLLDFIQQEGGSYLIMQYVQDETFKPTCTPPAAH